MGSYQEDALIWGLYRDLRGLSGDSMGVQRGL